MFPGHPPKQPQSDRHLSRRPPSDRVELRRFDLVDPRDDALRLGADGQGARLTEVLSSGSGVSTGRLVLRQREERGGGPCRPVEGTAQLDRTLKVCPGDGR